MTYSEKQKRLQILTTMSVLVCISTASQTRGSQRRDMLFTLAVNPIETEMHYSLHCCLRGGRINSTREHNGEI